MPPKKTAPAQEDGANSPSFVQQLIDLELGESVGQVKRLDGDEATKAYITETKTRMRNNVSAAVSRAKSRTGGVYTVESGEIITRSLDILCVVSITRIE